MFQVVRFEENEEREIRTVIGEFDDLFQAQQFMYSKMGLNFSNDLKIVIKGEE